MELKHLINDMVSSHWLPKGYPDLEPHWEPNWESWGLIGSLTCLTGSLTNSHKASHEDPYKKPQRASRSLTVFEHKCTTTPARIHTTVVTYMLPMSLCYLNVHSGLAKMLPLTLQFCHTVSFSCRLTGACKEYYSGQEVY